MSDDTSVPTIVIDNGSATTKAGFAGYDAPTIFPTTVGRLRNYNWGRSNINPKMSYIGDDAQSKRDILTLKYPMEHGIVTNWDDMAKIWQHIFANKLSVDPKEHPVLLTEAPLNPPAHSEKMAQLMFESFSPPALHVANQAVLSLFATKRHTGLVVGTGHGTSYTVSVLEGEPLPGATVRMDFAGGQLTDYLGKMLTERGYDFSATTAQKTIGEIKEKSCYVAVDLALEAATLVNATAFEKLYPLADGQVISLDSERVRCPEALFQPLLAGRRDLGISRMVFNSITMSCGTADRKKTLYGNIVLSGGSTLFPGFAARLQKDLAALVPHIENINVIAPPERQYSVWLGGSTLASLDTFQKMLITRKEYDETGPHIVHRKLFL